VILLDTSGLLAALDASQRHHRPAAEALGADAGPFLLSPFVLAELDDLLSTRVGLAAELALLDEVSREPIGWSPSSTRMWPGPATSSPGTTRWASGWPMPRSSSWRSATTSETS
jgi:hypothetical protein